MNKSKVGIITFHASHNYGSNLQAYALQQYVSGLGYDCEIINFRSFKQKEQYAIITKKKGFKGLCKKLYAIMTYRNRKKKFKKFEEFIENKLVKGSKEYNTYEELKNADLDYDYYISGSDQIWNPSSLDIDPSYFLPFVKTSKKIAYAPSFGQTEKIDDNGEIREYLKNYKSLSVREESGVSIVEKLTGTVPPIMPDPTLLINREQWMPLCSDRLVKGDYIFYYSLASTEESVKIAQTISKKLNIPVVTSRMSIFETFSGFIKKTYAGPQEFLSLVSNAKFVIGTSFHCIVFSIIFNKPFFAINGMWDKRISSLLSTMGLESRSVKTEDLDEKLKTIFEIDFTKANQEIKKQQERAKEFLLNALSTEE
ncbi:MAG: polysaccharide pyruvyl transferase family protein [Ruminococcus sp.]